MKALKPSRILFIYSIELALCVLFVLAAVPILRVRAAALLTYGQGVNGMWSATQEQVDYTFSGKTGDKLTIALNSIGGDGDPFIDVYDPQGKLIGEDDNSGGKDNALLNGLVLSADGTYHIAVINKRSGTSGKYSLVVNKAMAQGKTISYEGPEDQGKIAYQLTQPWNHTNITYRVENTQPGFNAGDVKATIQQAFQAWAAVVPLTFQEVSGGSSDLDIKFAPIDGAYNILGETCPPSSPCSGQIQFDSQESWIMGAPNGYDNISFIAVATHEFGHAIGLLHSSDSTALMYPEYSPYNLKPNADDVRGVQALYGAGAGGVANTTPAPNQGGVTTNNNGQPEIDGTINDTHFVSFWDFDVNAGEPFTITMSKTGGNLDAFLVLLDANNHILAYDDDGGGNRDAVLRNIKLPHTGTYTVATTRYQQAQGYTSGNFALKIEYGTTSGPTAPRATTVSSASGQAGNVKVRAGQASDLQQAPSLDTVLDSPLDTTIAPQAQTRNATVSRSQAYSWLVTWCAGDANTLNKNLSQMAVSFAVNNSPVDASLIKQNPSTSSDGLACMDTFVILSDWSPGSVKLTRTLTLKSPVFDGKTIYGQGDYTDTVNVTAQ